MNSARKKNQRLTFAENVKVAKYLMDRKFVWTDDQHVMAQEVNNLLGVTYVNNQHIGNRMRDLGLHIPKKPQVAKRKIVQADVSTSAFLAQCLIEVFAEIKKEVPARLWDLAKENKS